MTLDVPLQPHQLVATLLPPPRRGLGLGRGALRAAAGAQVTGPRRALTPPVGDVAADAHLPDELGEQAVLLVCPLLALQGLVVLLVLLQALEGAAAGLPEAPEQSRVGVTGTYPLRAVSELLPPDPAGTAEGLRPEGHEAPTLHAHRHTARPESP